MERKHLARELFLKTLTNMGIKYEIDDGQIIWFDYQGMGFDAEEDKNGRYVTLEYIDLKSFGNIGEVIRMRRIINKVSKKSNVVITSSIKSTHYSRNILFVKEIPDIENYLRTELQMLIYAYEMVNIELQNELGKEKPMFVLSHWHTDHYSLLFSLGNNELREFEFDNIKDI